MGGDLVMFGYDKALKTQPSAWQVVRVFVLNHQHFMAQYTAQKRMAQHDCRVLFQAKFVKMLSSLFMG